MTSARFLRWCSRSGQCAVLASFVATLVSCGGTEPEERGQFHASVTGSVTETVDGHAGFTEIDGEWSLHLLPEDFVEGGWQLLVGTIGPRPLIGTIIEIEARDPGEPPASGKASGDVVRLTPAEFDYWILTSGELRITASSSSRMSGTFQLSAEPFFSDGRGPIAISGTFDAIAMGERPGLPR